MRYTRITTATSYAACTLAWRAAGKRHGLSISLGQIVILVATCPDRIPASHIKSMTGANKNFEAYRLNTLAANGYICKDENGRHTGYSLGPKGVQFYNDYLKELRKVKKEFLARAKRAG